MNWAYVAGFFDGEGHVSGLMNNRRTPAIELAQSGRRGQILLQEIESFMQSQGLHSTNAARIMKRSTSHLGKKEMYVMRFTTDAAKVLQHMLPHLRIKKAEAQDVLRFHKMFPPNDPAIKCAAQQLRRKGERGRFIKKAS